MSPQHKARNTRFFPVQSLNPAVYTGNIQVYNQYKSYMSYCQQEISFAFSRVHVCSHNQPHRNCSSAPQESLWCFKLDHKQLLNTTLEINQHFLESGKRCFIWWEDEWASVNTVLQLKITAYQKHGSCLFSSWKCLQAMTMHWPTWDAVGPGSTPFSSHPQTMYSMNRNQSEQLGDHF